MTPRAWARAAVLASLIVASAVAAQPVATVRTDVLDEARARRKRGDLDGAEVRLRAVLRARPTNFLALYNMGLVEENRAYPMRDGPAKSAKLRQAADWLDRAAAERDRQNLTDATIFNTLGTVHLMLGDLARADAAYARGLQSQASLSPASRAKLLSNIGYLQAMKGNTAQADIYTQQGVALGSTTATRNLGRLKSVKDAAARAPQAPRTP